MSEDFLTSELMSGTNWRAMERVIARIMSHCEWSEVKIIGRRGDGGGDILATRKQQNERDLVFVVQVKCVTGSRYVGPNAIQEAIEALSLYNGDIAVVATNGEFTDSAKRRAAELKKDGIECKLWNGTFLRELVKMYPIDHWEKRDLRLYQKNVVEDTLARFKDGKKSVQYVVATGLGKTTIAAEIVSHLRREGLSKILVLCHSQDLSLQLEQSFWSQISKEVPTHVFFNGDPPNRFEGINFGTYQTLIGYLPGLNHDDFDVVIVDEAHHAMSNGFLLCLNYLRPRFMIGMTATPWRGDGLSLDSVFGDPIAEISLVDGMKMGFLAKVNYQIYFDTIDWRGVFAQEKAKSYTLKDLNKRLFLPQRDEEMLRETLDAVNEVSNPRIIFFCASVEHCKRVTDLVNLSGKLQCKTLSGVSRIERYRSLMEFSSGRIQAVAAVDVLNEGIDVPDVNIIVFLRVTHSRRIFIQQLGRGLRLSSNKKEVRVLDFVSDLKRLADILELDAEAKRNKSEPFSTVFFPKGFVHFKNAGVLPFIEQWLKDVATLKSYEEKMTLSFPLVEVKDE